MEPRCLESSLELSVFVDKDRQVVRENLKFCSRWREKAVSTVILLGEIYRVNDPILAYTIVLQDRFLAAVILGHGKEAGTHSETLTLVEKCNNAQSISAACFVLANKFVGSSSPRIKDIVRVLRFECSPAEIESSEEEVLKCIDWSLHFTTGQTLQIQYRLHIAGPPRNDGYVGSL